MPVYAPSPGLRHADNVLRAAPHNFAKRNHIGGMPNVLIKCPQTDRTVPTLLRMKPHEFEALNGPRQFRCSVCNQIHTWTKADAWVENA